MEFIEVSEQNIRAHSAGDARLYAGLADLALRSAALWPLSQNAGGAIERLGLVSQSLRLRMIAARLEPANTSHQFQVAMAYASSDRLDRAVRHADFACELLPRDPWIRADLAKGFLVHGRPDLARRYLESAEEVASVVGVSAVQPYIERVRRELQ